MNILSLCECSYDHEHKCLKIDFNAPTCEQCKGRGYQVFNLAPNYIPLEIQRMIVDEYLEQASDFLQAGAESTIDEVDEFFPTEFWQGIK